MLYKEASRILQCIDEKKGSIKNLTLSSKYKNKKQLYALVCETLKYKTVLTTIIEKTKLQSREKILRQDSLARVLVYDFLLGRGLHGHDDKFKEAVLKHKAALQSELARMKVKVKATKNEDLLPQKIKEEVVLPRYLRINTLKSSVEDVIEHFRKEDFYQVPVSENYESYIATIRSLKKKYFVQDPHIPEILVFAGRTDLHDHVLYKNGSIIFQDKASCLPAFVLGPPPGSHVIDCCAAPGNKTSHLAAILRNNGKVFAFDKDLKRVTTMNTLLLKAGVLCADVQHSDFLKVDPHDPKYSSVEYILLDPSCSGSGIVNRLNDVTDDADSTSDTRLQNLAKFQMTILSHALTFPKVQKVVYSTCSTNQVENESVVSEALKVVDNHFKLTTVMKKFPNRGQQLPQPNKDSFLNKRCLRMDPRSDFTNGFFIACMVKRKSEIAEIKDLVKIRQEKLSNKSSTGEEKATKEVLHDKEEVGKARKTNKRKVGEASETRDDLADGQKQIKVQRKTKDKKKKTVKSTSNHVDKISHETSLSCRTNKDIANGKPVVKTNQKTKQKKSRHKKHKPVTM